MAAGVVSAPLIITSSSRTHASRREIHTDTLVFIQSDTPGALIFYTLDGSRPEADQSGSAVRGRKYSKPIRLPAGRVAVRAVAVTSNGRRSSTVTKMFVVQSRDSSLEENVPEINQQLPSEEPSSSAGSSGLWTGGDGSVAQNGPHLASSLKQVRSSQTSRLVQDPDFLWDNEVLTDADLLRCAHCLTARPPDPFSRFCPSCGAKVSDQRLPPTGAKQEHRVCGCCGSGNPVNVSSCLTCESLQPVLRVRNSLSELTAGRKLRCCCACRWSNQRESRCCCSCCSSKPVHACGVCWRCGASGPPASFYCTACGVFLRAPTPPTAPPVEEPLNNRATPTPDCAWKMAPPTTEKSTQTVGLYYPSATQMQKERERALQLARQTARERQPPLTSISPGKGYWRRQLDHVCAHLRSYTQNNAPFRALLGDPCMGELLSAVVQDDQQQLTLTISFALVAPGKMQDAAGGGVDASQPPAGGSSLRSDALAAGSRSSKQLPVKDAQLMMELAPGRGQLSIVEQLLDQGADPACCRSDGRHALAVAVLNGHHQLLPLLVQRGASVDQQSGPGRNSALHEAAAQGSEGLQSAGVLLSCGANVDRKNASGQTAFQLAAEAGCNEMVSLLAAQTGLALLDKLAKRK